MKACKKCRVIFRNGKCPRCRSSYSVVNVTSSYSSGSSNDFINYLLIESIIESSSYSSSGPDWNSSSNDSSRSYDSGTSYDSGSSYDTGSSSSDW